MEKEAELSVGTLRQRTALAPSAERVALVTSDPVLLKLLRELKVVECYPDTTDEYGNWNGTFKIRVEKR